LSIDEGVKVNAKDKSGNTTLHVAAESGHKEIVDMLIKRGFKDFLSSESIKALSILSTFLDSSHPIL